MEEKGDEVRAMLYRYAVDQAQVRGSRSRITTLKCLRFAFLLGQREEEEFASKKNGEFRDYAANLHHLLSTKHIRGVFNPEPTLLQVLGSLCNRHFG